MKRRTCPVACACVLLYGGWLATCGLWTLRVRKTTPYMEAKARKAAVRMSGAETLVMLDCMNRATPRYDPSNPKAAQVFWTKLATTLYAACHEKGLGVEKRDVERPKNKWAHCKAKYRVSQRHVVLQQPQLTRTSQKLYNCFKSSGSDPLPEADRPSRVRPFGEHARCSLISLHTL